MPFRFDISRNEGLIYVTGTLAKDGKRYDDERAFEELIRLPGFNRDYDYLVDYTNFGDPPPPSEMQDIASLYWKYREYIRGKAAVVVKTEHMQQARVLATLLGDIGIRMEVYGDVDSAKNFLKTGSSLG